jgi:hypothetical protein
VTDATRKLLYVTPEADRFFLVGSEDALIPGDLVIVSVTGDKRLVDPVTLMTHEVSRDAAAAYLSAQAHQALSDAADTVGRALGLAGVGDAVPDPRTIAARLGLPESDLRTDPHAAKVAVDDLADDLHAIAAAVTAGRPADVDAARARLAARGIDVGDTLDELPRYLAAIRQLDQRSAVAGAASGLRAVADAIERQEESLGRRIDELIARLDREIGPFLGRDPERERRERQTGYERSARAAIAESLRAHGITPLAADEPDEPPRGAG